ncbi:type II toxin-antitoxin system VapC family toxin [Candidatus Parabeggiatoa sp. HSG14]|uniref:type II toxin-antitoxin system VapC family toxin n=1 Tax=Candidatus Parabeggiatoa sp. HSG14 TaxID=3055593 RepID=UPI0025A89182|nr:type II toxin-antitoxin system VapC family toxin [Thiotrichales bacterium HSG14]
MDVLTDVLMDTNTVSAMLKQDKQVLKNVMLANTAKRKIFFNTITYYETKRGLLATQATRKMTEFNKIRQRYEMLGTDNEAVLDKASEIYANLKQQGRLLPDADIFIAAVALTYNLTLVTADNHFDRIKDLKVENWLKKLPVS